MSDPDGRTSTGERDLDRMLATLTVARRPGIYVFVSLPLADVESVAVTTPGIEALIAEDEGVTVVAEVGVARACGWPVDFEAAWLTLGVHSALEAVGLTAAVSRVLADAGLPCNVLAGRFHDHLLVPAERADDAIALLEGLRRA